MSSSVVNLQMDSPPHTSENGPGPFSMYAVPVHLAGHEASLMLVDPSRYQHPWNPLSNEICDRELLGSRRGISRTHPRTLYFFGDWSAAERRNIPTPFGLAQGRPFRPVLAAGEHFAESQTSRRISSRE
jgi:hypothetical protein